LVVVTTTIRLRFDWKLTAVRPLYDRSTSLVTTGLMRYGLS